MEDVILHIGMHKTGTSSIQQSLSSYDDGSTRYATFSINNHSIPMTTIFSENAHEYHIWKNQGLSRSQVEEIKQQYYTVLQQNVSDQHRKRLIISGEDIGILSDSEKLKLINFFTLKNIRLNILCFTRDPLSLSSSSVQQHIRGGISRLAKINPTYRLRIECFKDNVNSDQMRVLDYKEGIAKYGDIVNAVSSIYDLDNSLIVSSLKNTSLSLIAAKLVFLFNKLSTRSFGTEGRMRARNKLIDFISDTFPINGVASKIDDSVSAGLVSVLQEDIGFLRDAYGIDYSQYTDSRRFDECESYFSDLRDIDLAFFRDSVMKSGIATHASDSIEDLLIALYYHFFFGNVLRDSDANYLRDIAVKIAENKQLALQDAVLLMSLANRARPTGPYISSKLKEYDSLLQSGLTDNG